MPAAYAELGARGDEEDVGVQVDARAKRKMPEIVRGFCGWRGSAGIGHGGYTKKERRCMGIPIAGATAARIAAGNSAATRKKQKIIASPMVYPYISDG